MHGSLQQEQKNCIFLFNSNERRSITPEEIKYIIYISLCYYSNLLDSILLQAKFNKFNSYTVIVYLL